MIEVDVIVEMQTTSEPSMNCQSGMEMSSTKTLTSYPLSLRTVASCTAPSLGNGGPFKACRPDVAASMNEILYTAI